ncbi:MAG: methylmalonyl Co-A mutase-associated GTPase MeaB [Thaumarchaeota archaeon]|nr:methylmalonyl Co-A mutase-associated GTPase MeaB [Nitrososphaerota archaeon]
MDDMLADLKKGKRRAIAKAITIIENDKAGAKKILKKIFKDTGNSVIIGITGPAGAGKSSLINKTVISMRKLRTKPAVLAVDPTSHVTGGAILGDRVRMTESSDSGTYIRSIASRGATGAISDSLRNSIRILEYAGFDPIIIESVGAGQTEIEISEIADITIVVFSPQTGDSIQAIKAGLTEIGDIYLVNKSDLDGSNQLYDALVDYIDTPEQKLTILKTSTKKNSGITQLAKTLKNMMVHSRQEKKNTDPIRLESELRDIVLNSIKDRFGEMLNTDKAFLKYLKKLQARDIDPYDAADKITKKMAV